MKGISQNSKVLDVVDVLVYINVRGAVYIPTGNRKKTVLGFCGEWMSENGSRSG